jgi:hypothetical protein
MTIQEVFDALRVGADESIDGFRVASLSVTEKHKLGITDDGRPVFFINCANLEPARPVDYDLEHISIQFNRRCQVYRDGDKIEETIYTLVTLKTNQKEFRDYFLSVVELVLKRLPAGITAKEFKLQIDSLAVLFAKLSDLPQKTVQGLWAELLVIEQAKDPDYLIKAWHARPTDTFDFNDGADKIEVKSTTRSKRQHSFSNAQLLPNKSSKLLIASVFMAETGTGRTIQDLITAITKRISNRDLEFRLNEVVGQVLGKDLFKALNVCYDYKLAADSLEYFESWSVPSIPIENIPVQISDVRFECDLSGVPPANRGAVTGALHLALFERH